MRHFAIRCDSVRLYYLLLPKPEKYNFGNFEVRQSKDNLPKHCNGQVYVCILRIRTHTKNKENEAVNDSI